MLIRRCISILNLNSASLVNKVNINLFVKNLDNLLTLFFMLMCKSVKVCHELLCLSPFMICPDLFYFSKAVTEVYGSFNFGTIRFLLKV